MYNDKPTAVAREVISNAIDANIESKTKNKVIVTYPTKLVPMFTVQDFGVGINKERLECFSSYGSSTKTNSNKEIGGGMFFKVSINNNAITVQKGSHKQ